MWLCESFCVRVLSWLVCLSESLSQAAYLCVCLCVSVLCAALVWWIVGSLVFEGESE